MKRRIALLSVVATTAFAGASVAPVAAPVAITPDAAYAHTCSSSRYRHAVLPSGHKCLGSGQFCTRSWNARYYRRYGFVCQTGSDGRARLFRR